MFRYLSVAFCLAGAPVLAASGAEDMVAAMSGVCVASLENEVPVGLGLTRAPAAMEQTLLNGKDGTVWRTWSDQVVIVAHNSGRTCEVMGLSVLPTEFAVALEAWQADAGAAYTFSNDTKLDDDGAGGAYLATKLAGGEYIQMFIESQPDANFIGITVSRVEQSAAADDVLGE